VCHAARGSSSYAPHPALITGDLTQKVNHMMVGLVAGTEPAFITVVM